MIDGNLAMNSHFENMSEKDSNEGYDNYIDQDKRKEAIAFAEWVGSNRYSFYWSNGQPRWYPTDMIIGIIPKPSYSNEELYDLYLQHIQSLTKHT